MQGAAFALVPMRHSRRLLDDDSQPLECFLDDPQRRRNKLPFVLLNNSSSNNNEKELGKYDLLEAVWAACRCDDGRLQKKNSGDGERCCCCCTCPPCTSLAAWVKPCIPRRLLRFHVVTISGAAATVADQKQAVVLLWIRAASYATMNYVLLIRSGGTTTPEILNNSCSSSSGTGDHDGKEVWMGPWRMEPGDLLRFLVVPEHAPAPSDAAPLEFQLCLVSSCSHDEATAAAAVATTHEDSTEVQEPQMTPNDDYVGCEGMDMGFLLPPRSRYAAALEVLDESGHDDDDDDSSSCLASQPFESQQVPWSAAVACEPIREVSEPALVEPLLEPFVKDLQAAATFTSLKPDPPSESTNARCGAIEVNVKKAAATDQDDTISPRSFPSIVASILERQNYVPVESSTKQPETQMVSRRTPGLGTTNTCIAEKPQPTVVPCKLPPVSQREGRKCAASPRLPISAAPQSTRSLVPTTAAISSSRPSIVRKRLRLTPTTLIRDADVSGPPPATDNDDSLAVNDKKFVLYFVEKGTDMHKKTHIEGLRTHAEQRGALVLDAFDKAQPPWPTHFVISQKVSSVESIASALGFRDLGEMSDFIGEHGIVCATRDWAAPRSFDKLPFKEPTMMEQIIGIRPNKKSKQKRSNSADSKASPRRTRQQNDDSMAVIRNKDLSELFRKLAKLHQECPLFANDDWKAYSFQLLSGRLRHLDFEVRNDPEILRRLKKIKGFGDSSMQIIVEYLETGSSSRISEFETNRQRVAMKTMMNIWGVGRIRASELVNAGYMRIGSVRQAVENGTLRLERNQYIGLECYEDIMEEMPRVEVEAIAGIVFATVKNRFPSAELTIMGSYRRGKPSCGDVDILITHPDYIDYVPPKALGLVVDELRAAGHIAHHLTFISGMKHELFESLPAAVANKLTNPDSYGRSDDKKNKFNTSSWMGVFNSPIVPGKHRRVDIKFYPYAERVFASLYFTGNGHFNRSMRLWATRKFNYTLSDHGIIDKNTKRLVLKDPRSEQDVFDLLRLKWKVPSERDCFDAVESMSGETASQLPHELTRAEIASENLDHTWIE